MRLRFGTHLVICGFCAVACGVAPDGTTLDGAPENEHKRQQALDSDPTSDAFCDAFQTVADTASKVTANLVELPIRAHCLKPTSSALSYLGSAKPKDFAESSARVNAQGLYCALLGADGAQARATKSPLGKFGMTARIQLNKKDPEALEIQGQKIGKLWAFGVGMDIDNQFFEWLSPVERQPEQEVWVWEPLLNEIITIPKRDGQTRRSARAATISASAATSTSRSAPW